ncbi:hypothetical protein UFOVP112_4 [uncultured Caudovirales phage]|uniref:IrrE N-terminal-like domain-containing protein n=1 Tax=uncultured Caudovirales phage TaxID=2100421 RepID=A0A6J5L634_9CAUD|nr:hypothetical protein UFOVP112_4 [uncultured Caudovirales phage]
MKINEILSESKIFEIMHETHENDFIKSFLPIAKEHLGLTSLPYIKVVNSVPGADGTTFGRYEPETDTIWLVTRDRHPKDALRTLGHELVHYQQAVEDRLNINSGETGSNEENEANALAGVLMRFYNEQNPE